MIKEIEKILDQITNLNVLVIGETIIDEFIFDLLNPKKRFKMVVQLR